MPERMKNMTEPALRAMMRNVASMCDQELKLWTASLKPKFVVLVFDDPGLAQYISSCNRDDVIKAMRECADRLERNLDIRRGPDWDHLD